MVARKSSLVPGLIRALWTYRGFVLGSVKREFQTRYLGSLFGATWSIISPISMIFVYLVIFSHIMRAKLPGVGDTLSYGLFLCAGVFTWTYFTDVLNRCLNIFIEQANLLKKSPFPRSSLPLVALLSATVNFAISIFLFILFLAVTGRFPGPAIIAMLPLLVIQQAFALGLGVLLGTLNVFFRDVGQLMAIVLQFWFWLTPIAYPPAILPEGIRSLIEYWNPLARLIESYQEIVLTGHWPVPSDYVGPAILAVASLLLGFLAFRRLSGELVDEL
jgi:lipopolysaccharide transport system permease protein